MIDLLIDFWPRWVRGAWVTVELTAVSILAGSALSLVAGLAMLSRRAAVRGVSRTYTELFRGTSVVVQLGWIIFVLPQLDIANVTPYQGAIVALSLNIGAYGGEFVRGAIQAVPHGQTEAAVALNMRPAQRMIRVILPQAVVRVLPPMGNLYIQLLKATAIVHIFFLEDLTRIATNIRTFRGGQSAALFGLLLLFYFVIAYTITLGVRGLERLAGRGQDIGRGAAAP